MRLHLSSDDRQAGTQYYYDGSWDWSDVGGDVNDTTSSVEVFPADGGRIAIYYRGDYPSTDAAFWTEDVQGIAHDQNNWFIAQHYSINRIALTRALGSVTTGDSTVSGIPSQMPGYNHFGDLDQANGYVYVPVQGSPNPPAVAVFRASDLGFVNWATLPQWPADGAAWLAVRPQLGTIVTSGGQVGVGAPLYEYDINWSGTSFTLSLRQTISLVDHQGFEVPLSTMQGGVFDPTGQILYLANGYCDTDEGYLSVFYIGTGQSVGTLQAQSANGSGPFNYAHSGGFECADRGMSRRE